jgi:hypothetical protein
MEGDGGAGGVRTVIKVDRGKLLSDSSVDQASDSDTQAVQHKKRIPVEASVKSAVPTPSSSLAAPDANNKKTRTISDIEDIPFADESEADERFYTPTTSMKQPPPITSQPENRANVRKRLLPSPPRSEPAVPSAEQIQAIKQAEQNRAKQAGKWPTAATATGDGKTAAQSKGEGCTHTHG